MLATTVCAFLQGARGISAIAQWIHSQEVSFWHALGYTRRPPKQGAFRELLMKLPTEQVEEAIRRWVTYCLGKLGASPALAAIAVDGKTLRGHPRTASAGVAPAERAGPSHRLHAEPGRGGRPDQ